MERRTTMLNQVAHPVGVAYVNLRLPRPGNLQASYFLVYLFVQTECRPTTTTTLANLSYISQLKITTNISSFSTNTYTYRIFKPLLSNQEGHRAKETCQLSLSIYAHNLLSDRGKTRCLNKKESRLHYTYIMTSSYMMALLALCARNSPQASDTELQCFLRSLSEQKVEWILEMRYLRRHRAHYDVTVMYL